MTNISFRLRKIVSHVTFLTFSNLYTFVNNVNCQITSHTSKNINNFRIITYLNDPSCSVMELLFLCTFIYLYLFFDQSTIFPVPTKFYLSTYTFDWSNTIVKISYPTKNMDPENDVTL